MGDRYFAPLFCLRQIILLALIVVGFFALPAVLQSEARAQANFATGSICHATAQADENYAEISGTASRWICSLDKPIEDADRHIVRFELDAQAFGEQAPRYLAMPRYEFDRMEVAFLTQGTVTAKSVFAFHDMFVGPDRDFGFIELPQTTTTPGTLVVTLDSATYPESIVVADLTSTPPFAINAGIIHIICALICGLLIAPILFDLGFARTLRESFPIYHAFFCLIAFVQTASISGLIAIIFEPPGHVEHLINIHSFDLMLFATIMFIRSFIEKGVLDRFHYRVLTFAAAMPLLSLTLINFHKFLPAALFEPAVYLSLGAMLIALIYVLAAAWRRGSRAVRFVSLAFAPLITIGLFRVTGALIPALYVPFSELWAQSFALLFEVAVTSFAVADRFLTIKRERDSAVHEARSLEALSERDALTGLLNRRALESRFDLLRAEGFNAIALVDLDHFKSVNDTYGHQVGDDVLICAAKAIRGHEDPDLLAFRIGGEEFLILLRGRSKQARAETRRRSVATAIAAQMNIEQQVTASMGFVEAAAGALADASFDTLYDRADRLLYEAKERGRDRIVVEKVRVFRRRDSDRRDGKQAA